MDLIRAILDQSNQLIVVVDCQTACVADCNEAQCRAAGRTRQEMVGRHVAELHVSFPLGTIEQWNYFLSRVEAEPGLTVDTQYRRKDGSFYSVRLELSIHELTGRRYLLVAARARSPEPALQSHLEREVRWQKTLFQMATHPAVAAGRFEEAAAFIAATGQTVFPADLCTIWRLEGERAEFVVDHHGGLRPGLHENIDLGSFPWLKASLIGGRCADIYATCSTDAEREKTRALASAYGAKAVLCAPVLTGGETWGVVTVGSRSEREWQPTEIGFAAEIADQLAHALLSQKRRQVEQELDVSQDRYRRFIEMSAEAVWRMGFDQPIPLDLSVEKQVAAVLARGRIIDCNEALAHFFQLQDRRLLIGVRLANLPAPVDELRLSEVRQLVEARYCITDLEGRYLVGGREKWVLRNVTGIFEDGCLVELWGATRDFTDRKHAAQLLTQSEQRYRAFVANSSEGIFRVEYSEPIPLDLPPEEIVQRSWDTGILAECNETYARMRGFSRPEDLIGHKSIDWRLRNQQEWEQDLEFLRQGCRIVDMERPLRRADGTLSWSNYSTIGVLENGCLARIWGRVADITPRKALEEELRALSARRASILEQERARIAREIHDELGQQLTALKFEAAAWERGTRQPGQGDLTHSIDEAIHTVRRIATELRPAILDHFGLVAAMEWMANEVSRRTGLECDCELEAGLAIDKPLGITVFRIFQEALTNVARHAEAKMVQVRLWRHDGRLELTVQDDGHGFASDNREPSRSLGLIGMRERALDAGGAVSISGVPGRGTRVSAWFPLVKEPATVEEWSI